MSTVVIVFIVWTIAAFIYSKVKGCGMFGAYFKVIFAILAGMFSAAGGSGSAISDTRDKAKRAGRDDIVDACDEADARRESMKNFFDSQK